MVEANKPMAGIVDRYPRIGINEREELNGWIRQASGQDIDASLADLDLLSKLVRIQQREAEIAAVADRRALIFSGGVVAIAAAIIAGVGFLI